MAEVVKICKVHGYLTQKDLKVGVYKNKPYKKCKKCEQDRSKEYLKKIYSDKEKHELRKKAHTEYWEKNKDRIKERRITTNDAGKRRETYRKYQTKYNESCKNKQREYRSELSDSYMRKIIHNGDKNIPMSSIPASMIALKRDIMLLKKGIKAREEKLLIKRINK